jgi:hypothetical protein
MRSAEQEMFQNADLIEIEDRFQKIINFDTLF